MRCWPCQWKYHNRSTFGWVEQNKSVQNGFDDVKVCFHTCSIYFPPSLPPPPRVHFKAVMSSIECKTVLQLLKKREICRELLNHSILAHFLNQITSWIIIGNTYFKREEVWSKNIRTITIWVSCLTKKATLRTEVFILWENNSFAEYQSLIFGV